MILTHYYHAAEKPFQTLSDLDEATALSVMSKLRNRSGEVYHRFKNPQWYWKRRQATETWLKQEFIRKGGQPILPYPYYFLVGRSSWIEEGFNGKSSKIQFPISTFSPAHVSFTYPDSLVSHWLKSQTDQPFYQPEYHGKVFRLSEILKIIETVEMPGEAWRTDETRKHDLFIEAQVWSEIPDSYG